MAQAGNATTKQGSPLEYVGNMPCSAIPGLRRLAIAVLSLALLAGCASSLTSSKPTATSGTFFSPTATAIPVFPSFTDWRVAYVGEDDAIHIVSLDGKTDLSGVSVPISRFTNSGFWSAGTAPDGAHLVYCDGDQFKYVDVHADHISAVSGYSNNQFNWSLDGRAVVVEGVNRGPAIVQLPSGATTQPSGTNRDAKGNRIIGEIYGWLDGAHLAVAYAPGEFPDVPPTQLGTPQIAANLDSLDIHTGALRRIATIRSSTMALGTFSLAPDGQEALFFNTDWRDFPFTPEVERVNTATGQVTWLPHLTSILTKDGYAQTLWIPRTHLALVATSFPENSPNGEPNFQLIDIDHDTATPVSLSGYPIAWSPDGLTLILSNYHPVLARGEPASDAYGVGFKNVGIVGSGPYTLTAVTFDSHWNIATSVILTSVVTQLPMLGFVHNP